jgi:hypothetical protein
MELGMDFNISFVTLPIEARVHPLCAIPDSSGDSNIYFVVLLFLVVEIPCRSANRLSKKRKEKKSS